MTAVDWNDALVRSFGHLFRVSITVVQLNCDKRKQKGEFATKSKKENKNNNKKNNNKSHTLGVHVEFHHRCRGQGVGPFHSRAKPRQGELLFALG